ncbi:MAG: vWA domain-containing protein [Planctomycetota bacterium]
MSFKSLKRWWQVKTGKVDTPIDGGVPFWFLSLAFHLFIVVLLAEVVLEGREPEAVSLVAEDPVEDVIEQDDLPLTFEFDEMPTDQIGADGDAAFEAAAAQAPEFDIITEDTIDQEMAVHEFGDVTTDDDFMEASAETISSLAVKGTAGDSVKAAAGAVDRITQEILLSMEERPTTVVWLFDQSASLMRQREEILGRFDRIYRELGMIRDTGHVAFEDKDDSPLLTQVYSFGARINPLLKEATDELPEIKAAIAEIETDTSGIENVMTAVTMASKAHQKHRKIDLTTREPKRNVMLIVVSDESGDDVSLIDETIKVCNRTQMPVYVIGVPAPFGRPETFVKWVDPNPDFDQSPQWAVVSQGPESIAAERLRLDFTGTFDDLDMIDSGFGPFHLTRLAYETGGIYFAVHPNRKTNRRVRRFETENYAAHLQYFFEPDVMRRYKPDYVSNATYRKRLNDNSARAALVRAAAFTTTGTLQSPRLRFPKLNEATFVNEVTQAQRDAAIIQPQLNRLYEMLRVGEKEREEERSLRWQAGYDLAIGRAIAAKVRSETYNGMLALVKTKKKFEPAEKGKPQNNTWVLRPAESTETGSQHAKLIEKAHMYLSRVMEDHPGTPWAMLASRELNTPIGWQWVEDYTEPPRPPERRQANNNNPPPRRPNVPMPRQNAMPKQKRPIPRL